MSRNVGENSVYPTKVGATIAASDEDLRDSLNYLIIAGNEDDQSTVTGVFEFEDPHPHHALVSFA